MTTPTQDSQSAPMDSASEGVVAATSAVTRHGARTQKAHATTR